MSDALNEMGKRLVAYHYPKTTIEDNEERIRTYNECTNLVTDNLSGHKTPYSNFELGDHLEERKRAIAKYD